MYHDHDGSLYQCSVIIFAISHEPLISTQHLLIGPSFWNWFFLLLTYLMKLILFDVSRLEGNLRLNQPFDMMIAFFFSYTLIIYFWLSRKTLELCISSLNSLGKQDFPFG